MPTNHFNIQGLSKDEVLKSREQFGENTFEYKKENGVLDIFKHTFVDPMVLLLLVAAFIYFLSGELGDGLFLSAAIVLIAYL